MRQHFKKFFMLVGFMIMAFVAINMNACSKKGGSSSSPNPYGGYGYPGGGGIYPNPGGGALLGRGVGVSGSGDMILDLTFTGQNFGPVTAQGILQVMGGVGCSVPPGTYNVTTTAPGQFSNGDFSNIQLMANNGMPIVIVSGWFTNNYDQYGNHIFAITQIPGCPTTFN